MTAIALPNGAPLRADTWAPIALAGLLALLAAVAMLLLGHAGDTIPAAAKIAGRVANAPATTTPPKTEPLELLDLPADQARAINAATPFVSDRYPAARPFRFDGSAADREEAEMCLASAVWYEAGNDKVGQRAVAQVVINRLRHPAFPKTICGVVFQGSERRTGCQFTFTCDGALARVPPADQWRAAREVAKAAMTGFVVAKVGLATHYHTDWVVPYWSASLDKLAEVNTHLFFRWKGWWGTPGAFRQSYAGGEQLPVRLAQLFGAPEAEAPLDMLIADAAVTGGTAAPRVALHVEGLAPEALKGNAVRMIGGSGTEYVLELQPGAFPGDYALAANAICKGKPVCTVMGWIDARKLPAALPVPAAKQRTASFVYRKNEALSREQALWNCIERPRPNRSQCLPGTEPATALSGEPVKPTEG